MHFANPQEARDFLAAHPEVRLIELMLIDANGIPRGKLLHRDELLAIYENGRPLPSSILSLTIQGEDVEESGLVGRLGTLLGFANLATGSARRDRLGSRHDLRRTGPSGVGNHVGNDLHDTSLATVGTRRGLP